MEFTSIGFFGKPHGVKGHISFYPSGDALDFCTYPLEIQLQFKNQPSNHIRILSAKKASKFWILKVSGIENPESAKALTRAEALCDSLLLANIPLKKGEILVKDLVGLEAYDIQKKQRLGYSISEVKDHPVHSILVFRSPEKEEVLVPFISQFVGNWDLVQRTIEVLHWEDWFAV